jgi:hypothetical protein
MPSSAWACSIGGLHAYLDDCMAPIFANAPPNSYIPGATVFLAIVVAAVVWRAAWRLRGTTLAAPALWATITALVFAIVEGFIPSRNLGDVALATALARYGATAGTFCPIMAVLGAKRPQDRGWQWVVASLWLILLVPAGQAWVARGGNTLELSAVWRVLLVGLAGLTLLNYGPTAWCVNAALVAGGQFVLLSVYFYDATVEDLCMSRLIAVALFAVAAGLRPWRRRDVGMHATERWLAFRNGWGAFWGLRVMHRINETAEASQWPVRLTWGGFAFTNEHRDAATLDERVSAHIEQTMDSLLWRFERRDEGAEA